MSKFHTACGRSMLHWMPSKSPQGGGAVERTIQSFNLPENPQVYQTPKLWNPCHSGLLRHAIADDPDARVYSHPVGLVRAEALKVPNGRVCLRLRL